MSHTDPHATDPAAPAQGSDPAHSNPLPSAAAPKKAGGKSRQRHAERAPAEFADSRRRLWTALDPEYRFTPHFVRFEDAWIHFVDEGPPGAPAVVFVHGNPTWSFLWRKQIDALRGRYRTIAIDLPGMGFSERLPGRTWRLEEHIRALEHLIEELGLDKVTLVLHDWGGPIGLGFARRHKDLVAGIVVMNTAGFPVPGHMPKAIARARHPLLGPLLVKHLGLFNKGALDIGFRRRAPLSPLERRGYLAPYKSAADREQVLAFVRDIPTDSSHPSYAELAAIGDSLKDLKTLPRLVVWGDLDPVFNQQVLAEWKTRWPDAEYVLVPGAGHFVVEDDPQAVTQALERFLAKTALA